MSVWRLSFSHAVRLALAIASNSRACRLSSLPRALMALSLSVLALSFSSSSADMGVYVQNQYSYEYTLASGQSDSLVNEVQKSVLISENEWAAL